LNCKSVARDLTELEEGKLPLVRRTLLKAHLAICPACKTYVTQMHTTAEVLHEVDEVLPEDESRAIAERILRSRREKKP
jgi:predicted anti-sigma-YlaC factor YlaD